MSFYTAINCMDGRVQEPVISYVKKTFKVQFVDMITEAGPVAMLQPKSTHSLSTLFNKIDISINKHQSSGIVIIAHHDCAGNPVSEEEQKKQLAKALLFLQQKYPTQKSHALWVNKDWAVEPICS
jgi:carbonic anhydrase